jgi:hypothetical protein
MRISQETKNRDVLDIGPPTSEGLHRSLLPQNLVGTPVLQVNYSSTRLSPKV